MLQSASECSKMLQRLPEFSRGLEMASKCYRLLQSAPGFLSFFKNYLFFIKKDLTRLLHVVRINDFLNFLVVYETRFEQPSQLIKNIP